MTELLILATVVIWVVYDIWIYVTKGDAWTESATIQKWAYRIPGIALLLGILMGHFFFQITGPTLLQKDAEGRHIIYQAGADIKSGQILVPNKDGMLVPK
jgi:hypothetical protein